MGFGKSLKKAFKKVRKAVTKPISDVLGKEPAAAVEVAAPEVVPPAAAVEVATPTTTQTEDEASTESDRRKARSGGKKSLSVSRSGGGGINL